MKKIVMMSATLLLAVFARAGTIIEWGAAGGVADIVAANTTGFYVSSAYSETTAVNPAVGASYYPNVTGKSPVFYAGASLQGVGGKGINTSISDSAPGADGGDAIQLRSFTESNENYRVMATWLSVDFLTTDRNVTSFSIEVKEIITDSDSTVRFLVKIGTQWYISGPTSFDGNYLGGTINATVSALSWYLFTPFGADGNADGVETIGAAQSIKLDPVTAVGFYIETLNTTARKFTGPLVRHFSVQAVPSPAIKLIAVH